VAQQRRVIHQSQPRPHATNCQTTLDGMPPCPKSGWLPNTAPAAISPLTPPLSPLFLVSP